MSGCIAGETLIHKMENSKRSKDMQALIYFGGTYYKLVYWGILQEVKGASNLVHMLTGKLV
jgi:hypothetical protein